MKLNSIRLEPSVIAAIYKKTLVAFDTAREAGISVEAGTALKTAAAVKAGVAVKTTAVVEAGKSAKVRASDSPVGFREPVVSSFEGAESTRQQGSGAAEFLGLNKRNILILVNFPKEPFMPKEEQTFLVAILSACQLRLEDVAIVNRARNPLSSFKDLISQLICDTVLLLGVSPAELELPVEFPIFQVQGWSNRKFLYAPPVTEIKSDKILKSKLWVCLQKLFNL